MIVERRLSAHLDWALIAAVLALSACGKGDNPLVAASDGQFKQWIEPKNAFSASCAAALYEPALYVKQFNGLKFSASGISTVFLALYFSSGRRALSSPNPSDRPSRAT